MVVDRRGRTGNIAAVDRNWSLIPKKPLSTAGPAVATPPVLPAEATK